MNHLIGSDAQMLKSLECSAEGRGCAWGFFAETLSIYRFRESRGSKIAVDVFGDKPHKGVLVVDRYAGYDRASRGASEQSERLSI